MPGTSRPSFVSSVRRRSGSGGLVSLVRPRRVATRETSGKRFQKSLESRSVSFKLLFAIKRVVSRSPLAPRKHLRENGWPSLAEHPASRQTNHDETTVFPRPQRETRERYAPATTTMTRPPTSTGIYPTVSARSPARRDRSRRVSLTLPPPPADDAQNTERPRREIGRPRTMLIDNFTVKSPNVTYTDEHIESTYTCVRQPDFPRDGSRRASPSHTAPVRVPVRDFRHVSVGRDFVSDRPPSFFHALTEIVASSARAGTTTRS